jgi:very-short-patch-repair endonuclease
MRTAKKYKFTCSEFHDFTASPDSVSAGKWCPHCHNKTETLIADALSARAIEFERQARFEWCRNIFCLPFDFRVGMTLVECDGAQHFQDVPLFKRTAAENRQRDVQKMKAALDNGYRIVRLSQVCVWTGKFDWRDELARALDSGEPVQYLSADPSIYDAHRADLENLQNPEK